MSVLMISSQHEFIAHCLTRELSAEHGSTPLLPADWTNMATIAEQHSAAPIVYKWLKIMDISVPVDARRTLAALALRHRLASKARSKALVLVLQTLDTHGIPAVLLKGAALAETVYAEPDLRPMRDVDILVRPDQAEQAARCLEQIGFERDKAHLSRYMADHHHLPNAAMIIDGMKISLEIHRDAIAPDVADSINLRNLTGPLRPFRLAGGIRANALGHVDMLRHLCHHSFEPAAEIRLIHMLDIVAYASHFVDEIDWQGIRKNYPRVLAGIRSAHFVIPLPGNLRRITGVPRQAPAHVGRGMRPLSAILNRGNSPFLAMAELLHPPAWWMHGYYGVDPDHSLAHSRLVSHPVSIARSLARRVVASRRHSL